ncbi:hypothetical protein [Cellulomonas sp. S1-8]|uniref:hypothetical protein n=1 Tax=Cellulomonas sp. S1-8 TaxID=2904790 RepID=UPI00224467A1|nr:hypothetical protein [Cellulomonas sp. S1-8]UZN02681.1 hypothetical protein OKX07_16735 [Cellulomonas sp. S1-8]
MPEQSDALAALTASAALEDLSFVELHALRRLDAPPDATGAGEPQFTLQAQQNDEDDRRFRLLLSVEVDVGIGELRVATLAQYVVTDAALPLPQRLVVEFANDSGIATMLPFLRHGIADLTQRVFGSTLLMPLLPRGAVAFPLPD